MRHVLVTGGTGLVGAPIVRRLLDDGCRVTVVSRRQPKVNHSGLTWIPADLAAKAPAPWRDVTKVDSVVHAAAVTTDAGDVASLAALSATNICASERLFEWCTHVKVRRVIFIGSLSVLAKPLRTPICEDDPLGPTSPYAMSKLWGEELLTRHAKVGAFTPIVLRISSPVPETFDMVPRTVLRTWIATAQRNEPLRVFGPGKRMQDFVACADVAEAVRLALEVEGAAGLYHIGSGGAVSMLEVARTIAAIRGTPVEITGEDPNDSDRWSLSLDRAQQQLTYVPQQRGITAIEALARTVL